MLLQPLAYNTYAHTQMYRAEREMRKTGKTSQDSLTLLMQANPPHHTMYAGVTRKVLRLRWKLIAIH